MLRHLRMIEDEEWRDGKMVRTLSYTDPGDPDNWIDDPCTFCGGESVPTVCPGDGRRHHHGAIHPPSDAEESGYWYICANPDCQALAEAAWSAFRSQAGYHRQEERT